MIAMNRSTAQLLMAAAMITVGCDSPDPLLDGGGDAGPVADGGPQLDAGPPCPSGEGRLGGVCLPDCGADLAALSAALGEGLTPVAHLCDVGSARGVAGESLFALRTTAEATETSFSLVQGALQAPFEAPTFSEVGVGSHDTGDVAISLFGGGYVAISDNLERAAFGYTTDADNAGGVFFADLSAGDPPPAAARVNAPGNFDVAFVNSELALVNGLGLLDVDGGEGLYAADLSTDPPTVWQVVENVGAFSGSVAVGSDYVVLGTADETFANHVFVVGLDAVADSETNGARDGGLDGSGGDASVVEIASAPSSTFERLADGQIAFTPFGGPITAHTFTWDGTSAALADPITLATGDAFNGVHALSGGRLLLVHSGGAVVVEPS